MIPDLANKFQMQEGQMYVCSDMSKNQCHRGLMAGHNDVFLGSFPSNAMFAWVHFHLEFSGLHDECH
jgi:hypothetical protein